MKTRIPLIVLGVFGLTAFSVAQDTEATDLVTWLCTSAVAQDPQTQQALKIKIGSTTHEDVTRLIRGIVAEKGGGSVQLAFGRGRG